MRFIAALSVPVLAAGFGAVVVSPASAHTPNISASCSGVHVGATAYDAGMANRWSVTINGATQTGEFASSLDQTFPVPQDGATTTWSAFVEAADGTYHMDQSGTVGPCGTPPAVQHTEAQTLSDCAVTFGGTSYGAGVLTYDEQFTDTYVWNAGTGTWDLVTDTEPAIANVVFTPWTTQEQVGHGCVDKPDQPPAEHSSHQTTQLDCADDVQVITTVTTTTPYVYDEATNTWVPGAPVEHTSTDETPVQPGDCAEDEHSTHQGGSSTHQVASSTPPVAVTVPPATASQVVPTSVDAGLAGAPVHAATVSAVSAQTGSDQRVPALLLLLTGGAALVLGAFRVRRS